MNYDRAFAYTFGGLFILMGVCGFIPSLMTLPEPDHTDQVIRWMDGNLYQGMFHFNAILSLFFIVFGLVGLLMDILPTKARHYAQVVTVTFAVLGLMGIFPLTQNLFGLMPLGGDNVGLNLTIALIAAVFGFVIGAEDNDTIATDESHAEWTKDVVANDTGSLMGH